MGKLGRKIKSVKQLKLQKIDYGQNSIAIHYLCLSIATSSNPNYGLNKKWAKYYLETYSSKAFSFGAYFYTTVHTDRIELLQLTACSGASNINSTNKSKLWHSFDSELKPEFLGICQTFIKSQVLRCFFFLVVSSSRTCGLSSEV